MSQDIAIIGIGLYPFGRHEGVNAIQMGVQAANLALDDGGGGDAPRGTATVWLDLD